MAINEALVEKIKDPEFWADMDENEQKDLLDSILTAKDTVAFRRAIIKIAERYSLVDEAEINTWVDKKNAPHLWTILNSKKTKADYFNSEDFLDPDDEKETFLAMQQEAAEQRVKLHLENETDKKVLLNIFKYNSGILKQYLEAKIPVFEKIPALQKNSTDILTPDVEAAIKKQALALWVAKAVQEVGPQTLTELENAYWDYDDYENEFIKVMQQKLPGFPGEDEYKKYIDVELIWQLVGNNISQLRDDYDLAQHALTAYQQYITDMDEATVLSLGNDIANLPDNIGDKDKLTPENKKALQEQLGARYVFKQAKDAITDMDEATVLRLGGDIANFPANLPAHIDNKDKLTPENIETLKAQLGARYLMPAIEKKLGEGKYLASLFVQDTTEKFIAELGKHFPGHTYLDKVVNKQFMDECKARMTPKIFSQLTASIYSNYELSTFFVKTESDKQFKDGLKRYVTGESFATRLFPGIDKEAAITLASTFLEPILSTLNPGKIEEVRKLARIKMFEIALFKATGLQPELYPTLVEEFSKLEVSAQHKLLPELGGDLNKIRHVVNAEDLNVLKHYMPGASNEALEELKNLAKQQESLKGILNPGVYKALASRYPAGLSADQVKKINDIIIHCKDWTPPTDYANRVGEIWKHCNPENQGNAKEKEKFYEAFGLDANGGEKYDSLATKVVSDISMHRKKYDALFDALNEPFSLINEKLLRKMLSLPLSPVGLLPNTKEGYNSFEQLIQENMLTSPDRQFFIDVCVSNLNHCSPKVAEIDKEQFRASLEKAITPAVFNEMQGELVREALVERNEKTAKKVVKSVETILGHLQQEHSNIGTHIQKAQFVFAVKEIHINNALIREKEKRLSHGEESTKDRYVKLAQECDVMMDQLRHDHARLKMLMDNIPETDNIQNGQTKALVGPEIALLKKKITDQLTKIEQQLDHYAQIKDKIAGPKDSIFTMIDKVLAKSYWYYQREELSSEVCARSELSVRPIKLDPTAGRSEQQLIVEQSDSNIDSEANNKVARFTLGDALKNDEVRCFDLVKVLENPTEPAKTVTVESRFTYDTSKEVSATAQGQRLDKAHPGRIEVQKFPSYKPGSAENAEVLEQAKVDFAMVLATQLLATMDRPPSKENPLRVRGSNPEQLKYIWTAFVVLGENMPGMRFGPEAVRVVNTDAFDPKAEKGWRGFSKTSLYETVFTKHMDRVNLAIKDSKEQVSERVNKTEIKESEAKLKETSNVYKSLLSTSREQAESRIQQHGVAAETRKEVEQRLAAQQRDDEPKPPSIR